MIDKNAASTMEADGIYICYRHCKPDTEVAEALYCLLTNLGFKPFLDRRNECLITATEQESATGIANCIENALDRAQALVGIVSANSFTSPWISYEMGSARGRKRLSSELATTLNSHRGSDVEMVATDSSPGSNLRYPGESVCIAHIVCGSLGELPAFLKLSTLIPDINQLEVWLRLLCHVCDVPPAIPIKVALKDAHLKAISRVLPRQRMDEISFEFPI